MDRAQKHGVTGAITISTTADNCAEGLALAQSDPRIWCSAGVHPLYSDRAPRGPEDWAEIVRVARHERCVAWGELGLDKHYDKPPLELQRRVLAQQLDVILGSRIVKPIVLHCREAFDELIPALKEAGVPGERCVFHCFTGGPDDARACLDFGAMISFTGVVTYKNAPEVRDAARLVPLDRIMVETDAPFLSPDPKRGVRPCEPWMTSITAKRLAEERGEDWDAFHAGVNENSARFFGVDAG